MARYSRVRVQKRNSHYSEYEVERYPDSKWIDSPPHYEDFGFSENEIDKIIEAKGKINTLKGFVPSEELIAAKREQADQSKIINKYAGRKGRRFIEEWEEREKRDYIDKQNEKYGSLAEKYDSLQQFNEALSEYEYWQRKKSYDFWMSLAGSDGVQFEHEVAAFLNWKGYTTQLTPRTADGGVDIIAEKGGDIYAVQCKAFSNNKASRDVGQKLNGIISSEGYTGGMIFTLIGASGPLVEYCNRPEVHDIEIYDAEKIVRSMGNSEFHDQQERFMRKKQAMEEAIKDVIPWTDAADHIGEKVKISGVVKEIATIMNGKAVNINIGKTFPQPGRVTAVIWEDYLSQFSGVNQYLGIEICVEGIPKEYKDSISIKIIEPSQIKKMADLKRDASRTVNIQYDRQEDWDEHDAILGQESDHSSDDYYESDVSITEDFKTEDDTEDSNNYSEHALQSLKDGDCSSDNMFESEASIKGESLMEDKDEHEKTVNKERKQETHYSEDYINKVVEKARERAKNNSRKNAGNKRGRSSYSASFDSEFEYASFF